MSSEQNNQSAGPLRARITKASYPYIARIHAMPKLTLPLVTIVLIAIGAFAPAPVAVPTLILLALLLAWLGFLSWPIVGSGARALRVFAVLIIALFAISRATT